MPTDMPMVPSALGLEGVTETVNAIGPPLTATEELVESEPVTETSDDVNDVPTLSLKSTLKFTVFKLVGFGLSRPITAVGAPPSPVKVAVLPPDASRFPARSVGPLVLTVAV